MVRVGRHELGPASGRLEVRTFREGLAARVGHDLVLVVTGWEATFEVRPAGDWTLALSADPRSLEVREALHGLKPLTDRDRAEIRRNIDEKVLRGKPIRFASSAVRGEATGRTVVEGDLTLAGRTRPLSVPLDLSADGRLSSTMRLAQTDWGIAPYRGLLGALKVADEVEVRVDVRLPAG